MFFKMFFDLCIKVIVFGFLTGCIFALLPKRLLKKCLVKEFAFEDNGKFYEKYFHILKWKDHLPQFSNITKIGFKKDSIRKLSVDYLETFYIETIRAEMTHFFLIIMAPLYFIVDDYTTGFKIFAVISNILGNIPFAMVQRYNRPRIKALLQKIISKNQESIHEKTLENKSI